MFALSGPGTSNTAMDVSLLDWADMFENELSLAISNPDIVDYDGRYSGTHSDGKSEEAF